MKQRTLKISESIAFLSMKLSLHFWINIVSLQKTWGMVSKKSVIIALG